MNLDLAHVRKVEAENGRLKALVEDLKHEIRMLKQLAEEPDEWSLPDAPGLWLTPYERVLLWRLHRQNGNVVHKLALLEAFYGLHPDIDRGDPKIVDVYICKARRKLANTCWRIKTRWGVGYYLVRERSNEEAA